MNQGSELFSKYNKRIRKLKDALIPLWSKRHILDNKERKYFESLKEEYADLYNLLRYMKNYKGKLERTNEKPLRIISTLTKKNGDMYRIRLLAIYGLA